MGRGSSRVSFASPAPSEDQGAQTVTNSAAAAARPTAARSTLRPLPPDWADVAQVDVARLSVGGDISCGPIEVGPEGITLSLGRDEGVRITPVRKYG